MNDILNNCILRDYKNNYKLLNYVDTLNELTKLFSWKIGTGYNRKLNNISIDVPSVYRTGFSNTKKYKLYKDNITNYKLYRDDVVDTVKYTNAYNQYEVLNFNLDMDDYYDFHIDEYATLKFKGNNGSLYNAFNPKRLSEDLPNYYKILASKNKDKYIYINESSPLSNCIFGFVRNVDVDEQLLKNNKDLIMIDDNLYEKIEKVLFEENPFDQLNETKSKTVYKFKFINLDEQNLYPTIDNNLFKLCDSKTNDTIFKTGFLYPLKKEEIIINKNIITIDSSDVIHNETIIMYSANDDISSSLDLLLTI